MDSQALVDLLDPDAAPLLEVPRATLSPHEGRWQPPVPDFALSRVGEHRRPRHREHLWRRCAASVPRPRRARRHGGKPRGACPHSTSSVGKAGPRRT